MIPQRGITIIKRYSDCNTPIGRGVNNITQSEKPPRRGNDTEMASKCFSCGRRVAATDGMVKQDDLSMRIARMH